MITATQCSSRCWRTRSPISKPSGATTCTAAIPPRGEMPVSRPLAALETCGGLTATSCCTTTVPSGCSTPSAGVTTGILAICSRWPESSRGPLPRHPAGLARRRRRQRQSRQWRSRNAREGCRWESLRAYLHPLVRVEDRPRRWPGGPVDVLAFVARVEALTAAALDMMPTPRLPWSEAGWPMRSQRGSARRRGGRMAARRLKHGGLDGRARLRCSMTCPTRRPSRGRPMESPARGGIGSGNGRGS